jgi:uncharacterized phage protein gp47/JayE
MSKYGVTPYGIVIKRLDEIIDEIHDDLSDGWNVNTRLNPKSFLNVQLTAFADKIAELWEWGAEVYYSMYPYSAEDASLDNAVQYGGISREDARPTFYPIHAECVDGTIIPRGSLIKTSTNPSIQFLASANTTVSRSSFSNAKVRVAAVYAGAIYTVALNATLYSYTSGASDTEEDILNGLSAAIDDEDFSVSSDGAILLIESVEPQRSSQLILSGNLTTESVTSIVNYASETNGEIVLPDGIITEIVTAVPGLISVTNQIPHIAGRLRQTDVELRKSYIDKIFGRSNRMLESIRSAILINVQGVRSVAVYQNDTNIIDADGRWPHCVEVVIDGGGDYDIALQIWDKKTDGIQTFGSTEVVIPGDEGEPITIRFNRPDFVYVWFQITISLNPSEILPPNYVEAIQGIIIEQMAGIEPGRSIVPQRLIEGVIAATVPGIAHIETATFYTEDPNLQPDSYATGIVTITPRQRGVTDETRIEVVLSA